MKCIDARTLENGDYWIQWASTSKGDGSTVKASVYYEVWPFDSSPQELMDSGYVLDSFVCVKVRLPDSTVPQYYEASDGNMVVDDTVRRTLPASANVEPGLTYTYQGILDRGVVLKGVEALLTNSTPEQQAFIEQFGKDTSALVARQALRNTQGAFAG